MDFEKIKNLFGMGEEEPYWSKMSDEEISRELNIALGERRSLGDHLKRWEKPGYNKMTGAKSRGGTGSGIQRRLLNTDNKIVGLREELKRRSEKTENQ